MRPACALRMLGPYGTRDVAAAQTLAEGACHDGVPAACVTLGEMYSRGLGVTRDRAQADQLFERACDAGDLSGPRPLEQLPELGVMERSRTSPEASPCATSVRWRRAVRVHRARLSLSRRPRSPTRLGVVARVHAPGLRRRWDPRPRCAGDGLRRHAGSARRLSRGDAAAAPRVRGGSGRRALQRGSSTSRTRHPAALSRGCAMNTRACAGGVSMACSNLGGARFRGAA